MPKIRGKWITISISIEAPDKANLVAIAKHYGLSGYSSAVRFVIRDWVRRVGWEDGDDGGVEVEP